MWFNVLSVEELFAKKFITLLFSNPLLFVCLFVCVCVCVCVCVWEQ